MVLDTRGNAVDSAPEGTGDGSDSTGGVSGTFINSKYSFTLPEKGVVNVDVVAAVVENVNDGGGDVVSREVVDDKGAVVVDMVIVVKGIFVSDGVVFVVEGVPLFDAGVVVCGRTVVVVKAVNDSVEKSSFKRVVSKVVDILTVRGGSSL